MNVHAEKQAVFVILSDRSKGRNSPGEGHFGSRPSGSNSLSLPGGFSERTAITVRNSWQDPFFQALNHAGTRRIPTRSHRGHRPHRYRKDFHADMTDLAAPGRHYTRRSVDTAV